MAFFDWNKNKKKDFGDDFIEYHIFREVMDDAEEDEAEPELYEDDMPELYDGNIPDLPPKKPKPIKYDKAAGNRTQYGFKRLIPARAALKYSLIRKD